MKTNSSPSKWLPVYEPYFDQDEEAMASECLRSTWISSLGPYIDEFEEAFARRCGAGMGVAICNGTSGLHLTLHALGIGPGDEVLVPTLTFVATANAVYYTGARAVLVDSEKETWGISPAEAERRITSRTKAILPVHLYGHPAQMKEIEQVARKYNLLLIEDASEAHFARIGHKYVGTFGKAGVFSLYGNKIITTGEGGMILTDDHALAFRLRFLRDHAMSHEQRYWHPEIGFNYRMTGLQAAVGLAQLRKTERILERKDCIDETYRAELMGIPGISFQPSLAGYTPVSWLFSILIDPDTGRNRDELMATLRENDIDSRPFFIPLHLMPPYRDATHQFPVAEALSKRGINLPSSPRLSIDDVKRIAGVIRRYMRNPTTG